MNDLIAKLEAATEGSRELDTLVAQAVGEPCDLVSFGNPEQKAMRPKYWYTTSIDAALTLVPDGWTVAVLSQDDAGLWHSEMRHGYLTSYDKCVFGNGGSHVKGTTPPLAICIAALKARGAAE